MPRITLVKKIKADGTPCRKCADVLERLEHDGLMGAIDRVIVADEANPRSEGMRLAARHGVMRAPFFVVEDETGRTQVHTVYFQLRRQLLRRPGVQSADRCFPSASPRQSLV